MGSNAALAHHDAATAKPSLVQSACHLRVADSPAHEAVRSGLGASRPRVRIALPEGMAGAQDGCYDVVGWPARIAVRRLADRWIVRPWGLCVARPASSRSQNEQSRLFACPETASNARLRSRAAIGRARCNA